MGGDFLPGSVILINNPWLERSEALRHNLQLLFY